jgi:hypothetical protein
VKLGKAVVVVAGSQTVNQSAPVLGCKGLAPQYFEPRSCAVAVHLRKIVREVVRAAAIQTQRDIHGLYLV